MGYSRKEEALRRGADNLVAIVMDTHGAGPLTSALHALGTADHATSSHDDQRHEGNEHDAQCLLV
jgi:hypothetical protein